MRSVVRHRIPKRERLLQQACPPSRDELAEEYFLGRLPRAAGRTVSNPVRMLFTHGAGNAKGDPKVAFRSKPELRMSCGAAESW